MSWPRIQHFDPKVQSPQHLLLSHHKTSVNVLSLKSFVKGASIHKLKIFPNKQAELTCSCLLMLNTLTDLSPKSNQSQNWQNIFTLIVPLHSTSVYYKEIPPVYHICIGIISQSRRRERRLDVSNSPLINKDKFSIYTVTWDEFFGNSWLWEICCFIINCFQSSHCYKTTEISRFIVFIVLIEWSSRRRPWFKVSCTMN